MKKVKFLFIIMCITLFSASFYSCKKSIPEVQEEETAKKEEKKEQTGKSTDVVRKITDEQFDEALELINRAKNALADQYDIENYEGSIANLKDARAKNDKNPEEAFKHLDSSRKMSQNAYYNSFKKRALEKKVIADSLISDLTVSGADKTFSNDFFQAKNLYNEAEKAFSEENYVVSYTKYSEAVDLLNKMKANQDVLSKEFESNFKYVADLIAKAEKLGAETYANEELKAAKAEYKTAVDLYKSSDFDNTRTSLSESEKNALKAIELTNFALKEQKRKEALLKIKAAGKSVQNAANKEVVDEAGKTGKGLDYTFEFEEDGKATTNQAPDSLTYKDVLTKAVEYIEKAKEAYYAEDYEMSIRYADIAKKIADSYTGGGIKTKYTVRLIPEKRDCLWRISEYDFIYNNPFYWPMIWKANKDKILNPDLIHPGQVFNIPEID